MQLLVFDSGIGGLGVVEQIRKLQPAAGIIYLADNAFFPYGEKPDEILLPHIVELIGRAIERFTPDAVVIACNTASTIALAALRAAYTTPFIGCVPPIKPAAAASKTRHIGVLATAATVRRTYLQNLIEQFAPDCTVHTLGTPTLAELAEQKFRGAPVDVGPAIAPLFLQVGSEKIDAIALGCTHYTFLLDEFQALYPGVAWFDPALPVAKQTFNRSGELPNTPFSANGVVFVAALPDLQIMRVKLAEYGFTEIVQGFALHPPGDAVPWTRGRA